MRRAEMRDGLLDRVFGTRTTDPHHDATADRLQRALQRLEPDPLFRRRLRGSVMNHYVATREGHLRRERRPRRQMGTIGRSVLYASVVLALGVSAVGAASQHSLPGDPLYGIKIRLEEIRMQIAPPSVRDELAELALAERTSELEGLVEAGAWGQVPVAAGRVASAEVALIALEPAGKAVPVASHAREVLQAVLDAAPAAAVPGLERALSAAASGAHKANPPAHASGGGGSPAAPKSSNAPRPSKAPHPTPGSYGNGAGGGGNQPTDDKHPD